MITRFAFLIFAFGGISAPGANLAAAAPGPDAALRRIAAANNAALVDSSSANYANAGQIYPFAEGALYRLFTAPGRVSDIALQPGEELISVAAGDTLRWVVGDTSSGSGPGRRTHILVKPSAAGLRTNLVIATDRRVYLLELQSNGSQAMPAVSWSYPRDELLALARAREAERLAAPVASGVSLASLDFNYRVEGDTPAWRPLRAFDDGHKVFIEFPVSIATDELPPLFLVGRSGEAELVNYRLSGRYYVVDRLFEAAELRLGAKKQDVVRIVRGDARGSRRGKAS